MKEKTNSHGESTRVEGTCADSSERVSTAARKQNAPVTNLEKLEEYIMDLMGDSDGRHLCNQWRESLLKDFKEKNKDLDRIFVNNFHGYRYCPDWIKGHFTKIIKEGIK